MTIDEVIEHAEEIANENQKVIDTHIVFDDVTIDMLYCDDTEVIDEKLADFQRMAEEYRQIAEWLKELKEFKQIREKQDSVNSAHWLDNDNGTISCSHCHTWFYKNNRYSYMRNCPYCRAKMEIEE